MQGLQASLKARTLRSSQGGRSCWPFTTAWQETRNRQYGIGYAVAIAPVSGRPTWRRRRNIRMHWSSCARSPRQRSGARASWRFSSRLAAASLHRTDIPRGDPQSVRKRLQPERRAWRAAQGIAGNLRTLGTLLDEGAARSRHPAWRNAARQGRSIARPDGAGRRLALPRKHAVHAWRFCPRARPPRSRGGIGEAVDPREISAALCCRPAHRSPAAACLGPLDSRLPRSGASQCSAGAVAREATGEPYTTAFAYYVTS